MAGLTYEEKVALFGEDVANAMQETEAAQKSGGITVPYTSLKVILDITSELGGYGEFVFGVDKEKQQDGTWAIKDKGTNVGKEFQFIPVTSAYRYTKWDAVNNKTLRSTIFMNAADGDTAFDHTGARMPSGKEAKKEQKWAMVKIVAGFIRKNAKATWTPVIWEIKGKTFFTYNNVANQLSSPILGGILNIKTKFEKNGNITYTVIDDKTSTVEKLPDDFLTQNRQVIGEMTIKMKEYFTAYSSVKKSANKTAPHVADESDDDDESNW